MNWIYERWKFLRHLEVSNSKARCIVAKDVWSSWGNDAKFSLYEGQVNIGYPFPHLPQRATYNKSVVAVANRGLIEVHGNLWIAPGTYIHVCEGAKLIFRGNNFIAHNTTIIVGNHVEFGKHVSTGWNCTFIDYDRRQFYSSEGKALKREARALVFEDYSGVQMNVVIPQGVRVGERAVIGANTVVRQDVPAGCLVYQNPELKVKKNVTPGLHLSKS
ncbi:MAG: hypothetical protein CO021_00310 [Deltaproteobacteria bacterium CG_4_9_14_0_2_um_filter_42_21]|nr:MAG: hypothetical protein CO021_00310 [Deltaproteobacteria bacterium CG_4_9_14_0_2_um_filter_42_21]